MSKLNIKLMLIYNIYISKYFKYIGEWKFGESNISYIYIYIYMIYNTSI